MLNTYKYEGSRTSGAYNWFLQRLTGILLVVVLVGHYILMHATPDTGHTYIDVMERLQSPWWKAIDLTFISLGLWHGLNGTWNVLRDFKLKPFWSITLYTIILLVGLIFWFLGVNTILSF